MKNRYVFFGTPHIARLSLEALEKVGNLPSLIVTAPARPQGRGLHLVETPVAAFAREHDIPCIMPEKITAEVIALLSAADTWDFFFIVAYGKILPTTLLDIVDGKVLNLHPSLLPKYRGPSPLESVLLSDDSMTGVSIMELDAEVDHGPIVVQESFELTSDMTIESLTEHSAELGIALFDKTIAQYLDGSLKPTTQDDTAATKTRKYVKADARLNDVVGQGLLNGIGDDWGKWKIFRAFGDRGWVHFSAFRHGETLTIKITKASYVDDAFVIEEVIPENGKRQSYDSFLQSLS